MDLSSLPKKTKSQEIIDMSLDPLTIFDTKHLYSESTKYNRILQNIPFFSRYGASVRIERMDPMEYLHKCEDGFHVSQSKNLSMVNLDSVLSYISSMRSRNQLFPVPILVYNYVRRTFLQEGRHRAVAAHYIGLPYIPVCVIEISNQKALDMIDNGWFESNPNKG